MGEKMVSKSQLKKRVFLENGKTKQLLKIHLNRKNVLHSMCISLTAGTTSWDSYMG